MPLTPIQLIQPLYTASLILTSESLKYLTHRPNSRTTYLPPLSLRPARPLHIFQTKMVKKVNKDSRKGFNYIRLHFILISISKGRLYVLHHHASRVQKGTLALGKMSGSNAYPACGRFVTRRKKTPYESLSPWNRSRLMGGAGAAQKAFFSSRSKMAWILWTASLRASLTVSSPWVSTESSSSSSLVSSSSRQR